MGDFGLEHANLGASSKLTGEQGFSRSKRFTRRTLYKMVKSALRPRLSLGYSDTAHQRSISPRAHAAASLRRSEDESFSLDLRNHQNASAAGICVFVDKTIQLHSTFHTKSWNPQCSICRSRRVGYQSRRISRENTSPSQGPWFSILQNYHCKHREPTASWSRSETYHVRASGGLITLFGSNIVSDWWRRAGCSTDGIPSSDGIGQRYIPF